MIAERLGRVARESFGEVSVVVFFEGVVALGGLAEAVPRFEARGVAHGGVCEL